MESYSKKILRLLQEFSYLLFSVRNKGIEKTTEHADLEGFDPYLKPIVTHGLYLLTYGMEPKRTRMFLELKRFEALKNSTLTTDELKLVQLSIECFSYLQSGDLDGYRGFASSLFNIEGNPEDGHLLFDLLTFLLQTEKKQAYLNKQEFNTYILNLQKKSKKPPLPKNEIDNLLLNINKKQE